MQAIVAAIYRTESRRVLATLIRLLGDFDRAEEALHDAFATALARWPKEGVPARPRAWLVSTGRFQAVDALRHRQRLDASLPTLAALADLDGAARSPAGRPAEPDEADVADDHLRLVFTCCHPALPGEAQIALTLREVCGLTTEAIARGFLTTAPTIAQRIVRAKAKIRESRLSYDLPPRADLPARLDAVLRVVYLVFNEGYAATSGTESTRPDLAREAIRLGRLLVELLPEPEAIGLLALMLLHDARRAARTTPSGAIVLLDDQDRATWDRAQIAEGAALVEQALRSRRFGPYTLQAAIAAVHAESTSSHATDWPQIIGLYDLLRRVDPSPVIELNRAVAVGMRDGPAAALTLIDAILTRGDLRTYLEAHATRADMLRRLGRRPEAHAAYQQALRLATQEPTRRFLEGRLRETQG